MIRASHQSTAFEAVQKTLAHIERQAQHADADFPYDHLLRPPDLPMDALADTYALTRLDDPASADALPSLLVDAGGAQAQVELCPFGPLALITTDGDMDTDPLARTLLDAGITPLFPHDLDAAGDWHGAPLARWLFPARLADALARFDALRANGGTPGV